VRSAAFLLAVLALGVVDTEAAADTLRVPQDAKSLAAATDASLSRGDYEAALRQAQQALEAHQGLGADADAAWDLNAIGLAHQYLGRYGLAIEAFRRALVLDRRAGSQDGELMRLNNIGTVDFLQGRYSDALTMYQEALGKVEQVETSTTRGRLRKMTISNLAALHQRLGADERALDFYAQLRTGEAMTPAEEAQLLVNQGVLARRLGDPVKALDLYRSAQRLFAQSAHRDGEIGAWRNIGIVYALDQADYPRALGAFDTSLGLARASSNRRGEAQALLYRGEVLRRTDRLDPAQRDLQAALDTASTAGLVDEQWKARYALGLVADAHGDREGARRSFERAIGGIESVRTDLKAVELRSEFLADKRDVYDALVWLRLHEAPVPTGDLFGLLEQSRARVWRDRLQLSGSAPSLDAVRRALPEGTLLLEYWVGRVGIALLWISRDAAGVISRATRDDDLGSLQQLAEAVASPAGHWRPASAAAGQLLLAQIPRLSDARHLIVVADGPLQFVPFETLTMPGTGGLVVERLDVSYLPSAAFVLLRRQPSRRLAWPWQRELVAFANPSSAAASPLEARRLPQLPYAEEEVQNVARAIPGRAEIYAGSDARKQYVTDGRLRATPLVHFSTHAIADTRDPDRSRIVLAPASPKGPADYLFLREVTDLDLSGVQLVTLSACETERGKVVRGEGVEGFSRALLAAGAAATVTTLWDVADRPSAELMTRFYASARGSLSTAEALQDAKRQFLTSRSAWSHPYYWAGYLLSGDGQQRWPRVVRWRTVAAVAGVALLMLTVALRWATSARWSRRPRRTADQ
jgi:tetratricopeptide (TPR) repeat protein